MLLNRAPTEAESTRSEAKWLGNMENEIPIRKATTDATTAAAAAATTNATILIGWHAPEQGTEH